MRIEVRLLDHLSIYFLCKLAAGSIKRLMTCPNAYVQLEAELGFEPKSGQSVFLLNCHLGHSDFLADITWDDSEVI